MYGLACGVLRSSLKDFCMLVFAEFMLVRTPWLSLDCGCHLRSARLRHFFSRFWAPSRACQVKFVWFLQCLSLIHISEPTRRTPISYAVFCLKKKKKKKIKT